MAKKTEGSFGFLGKPPKELLNCPKPIIDRWKDLTVEARRVFKMRGGYHRTNAVNDLSNKRNQLLEEIFNNATKL